MLFDEDARRQRRRRVVVEHRDRSLEHDGAAIELAGDEMDVAPLTRTPCASAWRLRVDAGKGREQRGVDVQDGVRERRRAAARPTSRMNPARQTSVTACRASSGRERGVVVVARAERAMVEHERVECRRLRARDKPAGVRLVGDDDGDARVETAALHGVDERLQVAAAPGDEYADRRAGCSRLSVVDHAAVTRDGGSPIATAPGSPAAASIISAAILVRLRADDHHPDPHVERAQHVVSGTWPVLLEQRKSAGRVHASRSNATGCVPAGKMRGRLSVIPPPVMCAMPLIRPAIEQRTQTGRYERCGASSASPTVDAELAARACRLDSPAHVEHDPPRQRVAVGVQPRRRQRRSARHRARSCCRRSTVSRATAPTMNPATSYSPSA